MDESGIVPPSSNDWHAAATELVLGFKRFPDMEDRLRILERFCRSLDDDLYPALLQILLTIDRHGDPAARELVAQTLAYAVSMQRLPSGRMLAWGSTGPVKGSSFAQYRSLGPIEYLCSWYSQPNGLKPLTPAAFRTALTGLLNLVNSCEEGRQMYQQKLAADSEDALTGALSGQTRNGIRELASNWQASRDVTHCVDAFLNAIDDNQRFDQLNRNPFA